MLGVNEKRSSTEKIDINEKLDNSFFVWAERRRFCPYWNSLPVHETDRSSVWPHFEMKNETALIEEVTRKQSLEAISDEDIAIEMLKHDFVVKIPPKRRYKIQVSVRSIRKGEPRIIESDEELVTA